jgi:hypothetical protein
VLTHAEINERFLALDRSPVLMRATFNGWLAWPIVKERLWLLCLNRKDGPQRATPSIADAVARLSSGALQLAMTLGPAESRDGALFYEPRQVRLPDGRFVHPHLGDLSRIEADGPWLHCRHRWGPHGSLLPAAGVIEDAGTGAVAAAIATIVRRSAALRALALELVAAIAPALPEMESAALLSATADQLGRFRVRAALARRFLRHWRVRRVVVLDPDGKVPEVAAAKSLGLPVTEVQHGMFSAREPDYSWGAAHRALACRLPLPDRIVVFGPLWSDQLRRAAYWRDDEIIEAQNPALDSYRRMRSARPPRQPDAPLCVLFASQDYVRSTAIPFWRQVLTAQPKNGAARLHLRIKIHPLEWNAAPSYQALVDSFPDDVSIAPADSEAFDEMLGADLVVGYTSLMLIEAIGIGIPALGLRGGAAQEGLGTTFDAPVLDELVPSFEQPGALRSAIVDLLDPTRYHALASRIQQAGGRIYATDGPPVESVILR